MQRLKINTKGSKTQGAQSFTKNILTLKSTKEKNINVFLRWVDIFIN